MKHMLCLQDHHHKNSMYLNSHPKMNWHSHLRFED